MSMSIAVLMTCYNRKDKTLKSLDSLFQQLAEIDVFLVDDGCTDGTGEVVVQHFPQVNIIQGTGNLFWNGGMHLAWITAASRCEYDHYLWLNDDTLLYPNAIQELMTCSGSENYRKIICGTTCSSNDSDKITYGGWLINDTLIKPNGQKQHCDFFNGNIVLIPRYVYSAVGTNDPVFSHALGDFDYGLRAHKLGIESIVTPHVLGTCDEHKTLSAWCHPKTPVLKRLKLLYSPLGNHPGQHFIFEKRHYGFWVSCFHFLTIHLRVLIPILWKLKTSDQVTNHD